MTHKRNVAILIFDEVEVLDFAGPFEVFAVSRRKADSERIFNTYTVAQYPRPVFARNGLSVNPAYTIDDCPAPDVLLVPGGQGTRLQLHNPEIVDWIAMQSGRVEQLLSVCTGALLLAKAGLLDGLSAATYHTAYDLLGELAPTATLCPGKRYVDNGKIVTSAGISAGIDMALHVVGKLHGVEQALYTAERMEYFWTPDKVDNPL